MASSRTNAKRSPNRTDKAEKPKLVAEQQTEQQKYGLFGSGGVKPQPGLSTDELGRVLPSIDHVFPKPNRPALLDEPFHRGFFNLAGTMLTAFMVHHTVQTYRRTGYLADLSLLLDFLKDFHGMLALWLAALVVSFVSIPVQHMIKRSKFLGTSIYVTAQVLIFVVPPFIFHQREMSPLMRGALCLQLCVISMKMHSYFMFQWPNPQPKHISARRWMKFLCLPTLVYSDEFPYREKVDYIVVLKLWTVACGCFYVMYLLVQEYLYPFIAVKNLMLFDTIIRLMIPSLMIWMLGFYGVFHCLFGGLAELTHFDDREFYLDWWNSTSMHQFWRKWNRPVYKWMSRHVYFESLRQVKAKFYDRPLAAVGTFFVTAVLHEYVLANAFGMVRPYLFAMIIFQIPYIYITAMPFFLNTRWGNAAMWIGLMFGFPLAELSYVRDYLLAHGHITALE